MDSNDLVHVELRYFQDYFFQELDDVPGQASRKELKSLKKFHRKFEFWPLLNDDCKINVVKFLDLNNRFNLGICSKSDYRIVENTPISLGFLEVKHNDNLLRTVRLKSDHVFVRLHFNENRPNFGKTIIFAPAYENDTQIIWHKNPRTISTEIRSLILESCNYHDEAVKFIEKLMRKCKFSLRKIDITMPEYPTENSLIKSLPNCRDVRIGADDVESFKWWLDKVPDELDNLELIPDMELRRTLIFPSDFLENTKIKNTRKFNFFCQAAFTDEQFLNLKATDFGFECVHITDEAINRFLKNWTNGKCQPHFTQAELITKKERDEAKLIKGIDARPWNDVFREETGEFCEDNFFGDGTFFQIPSRVDPHTSLTLVISESGIFIYLTGKKCEKDGQFTTEYLVPYQGFNIFSLY